MAIILILPIKLAIPRYCFLRAVSERVKVRGMLAIGAAVKIAERRAEVIEKLLENHTISSDCW